MRPLYATNMQLLCYQPGHVDEQLKERLKSQKEENQTCLLKIVQSISYLSRQGIALRTGKQDEESNFKQLLLRSEDDKCFESGLKSLMTNHMSPYDTEC